MNIAVVILNWNNKELLHKFIPSLLNFSKEATLYVIDNASTDESVSFLENNFPTVKIIKNKENYGFAKGYNIGLKKIEADIFCLLNSDVEVTENWLNPIINLFNTNPELTAIQPKILDYFNKLSFEYAGAAGGFIDKFGYPYCRGRILDKIEIDNGQYNDTKQIMWASGACLFIKTKEFKKYLFDEDFFAHMEEIDLCWRLQNDGKQILYSSQSVVYHMGGASLNRISEYKTYLNFRNNLFMLVKNLPKNKLIFILFTRMVLDGIAAFCFLFKNRHKHFFAVLKAHLSFYKSFNKFYKKRQKNVVQKYYEEYSILLKFLFK